MASDSSIQYSIVVPFFNEQENIPPLYMKLTEVMDGIGEPYELVFVDDGSKDDTFKVLAEIDRKSTRLNSSHGYISYAVFCLKKKYLTFFCIIALCSTHDCSS